MTTTEQLEREAEATRAHISATLDELRARMTPGHVVDQLVDYANDSSAGAFFRNLREQVVANPLPVALMGAGVAWLALSNRRNAPADGRRSASIGRTTDEPSERLGEWSDQAQSAASGVRERATTIASDLQETAGKAAAWATGTAHSTYESAAERADEAGARLRQGARSVADTSSAAYEAAAEQARRVGGKIQSAASQARDNVANSSRSVVDFMNEQPLVLVGIGLALGAMLGAALPATDTEDEVMGETSDAMKRQTAALAEEQLEKGEAVAEQAWEAAKQEADKQGIAGSTDRSEQADDAELAGRHVEEGQAPLAPTSEGTVDREYERSGP
jgi:ElaB/YqjD/DUF883 family membrane-anchored ribosome-binding protein